MAYRYLWTPLAIGPVTVRNRIVFSAHLTNYARDGLPTEQHAAYYAARAAGGAGLIITEEHSTHPTDWPYEKLIHGFHRDVIPGYRRDHRRRAPPRRADLRPDQPQRRPGVVDVLPPAGVGAVARSPTRCSARCPRRSTHAEIAEIVAGYALVAEHCAEGGFDGIELQCSHSSIVRGFLSPATNRRTDEYGGSLENRARLLLEIVAAVRERDRPRPGARRAALRRRADRAAAPPSTRRSRSPGWSRPRGQVDYINTSIGVATASLFMIEASMHVPPGLRAVHPVGASARPSTCRSSASAGSRTRCRPSGRWPRATATSSASCAARSPTPTSPPRPAPAPPTTSACACRATRSASAAWA